MVAARDRTYLAFLEGGRCWSFDAGGFGLGGSRQFLAAARAAGLVWQNQRPIGFNQCQDQRIRGHTERSRPDLRFETER